MLIIYLLLFIIVLLTKDLGHFVKSGLIALGLFIIIYSIFTLIGFAGLASLVALAE